MTVDELERYGMSRMGDEEVGAFLSSQRFGVLGLPGDDVAPYVLPLSYGYDGDRSLFFSYVLAGESQKRLLSDESSAARFLVYRVDSTFNWTSVLLSGTVDEITFEEWTELRDEVTIPWRPDLLERAGEGENVRVYRFVVEEWTGIRHAGLPPKFETPEEAKTRTEAESAGDSS
jgi:hypothetical protein